MPEYVNPNIDGWMFDDELEWLYQTAKQMRSVAELGSWKGRSTHALLSGCPGTVTAIDTWLGSINDEDDTKRLAKESNIYAEFMRNVGSFPNLRVWRTTTSEGSKICRWLHPDIRLLGIGQEPESEFDMVFIDASHRYEDVAQDIRLWTPLTKRLLCGHDYVSDTWMGVRKAVDELVGPVEVHHTIWAKWIDQ